MSARRIAPLALATSALLVAVVAPARAHPLGNFTVNRFSAVVVSPHRVAVHYVVDMAEIPTFQQTGRADADQDGDLSSAEVGAFARGLAARLLSRLDLRAAGGQIDLEVATARGRLQAGQGGLKTMRVEALFVAPLRAGRTRLEYRDGNYRGRLGWAEVVAYGADGQGIASSSVPSSSVSDALRAYPRDGLSSPLEVTAAVIETDPGATPTVGSGAEVARPAEDPRGLATSFTSLVERRPSPGFLLLALLIAGGAGALHALGPGHGKTVMVAYLVGGEGRLRHALTVGVAVSLMHTLTVVLLGVLTLWTSSVFPPEAVYPWLSFASGAVVLVLGLWLLAARTRARRDPGRSHDGAHGRDPGHDHNHSHLDPHGHGHSHRHAPRAGASPLSARGLVAVALSGGLLPSPTALVVLLGALALERVALGVALVASFSVGLALALTAVGWLVLRARAVAARHLGAGVSALLPLLSAGAITALGLVLTARAAIGL
jgi:nickel/cobalt exporter